MKRPLLSLFTITLAFLIFGCSFNMEDPHLTSDKEIKEEPLAYKIEKISLSKGFQSTEPNVEILKNSKDLILLANIGLVESSGVNVDRITKAGKNINIYVDTLLKSGEIQLAVPQVVLEIKDTIDENIQDLKFNIINQNYNTISLKYNKDQILDRIYSHFKIEPTSIPDVKLTKLRDQIIWNISFTNIYNKENIKSPLVNLKVKANALTGKILDSTKEDISTCIDNGILLDYMPNSYILYKRSHVDDDTNYETLWAYSIETKSRNKLYTSRDRIHSAIFNPNGQYISLIEMSEDKSNLYIISKEDKTALKISSDSFLHPRLMKWKDDCILSYMNIKDNFSTLLAYNIEENKSSISFQTDKVIESFDLYDNRIIYIESDKDSINKNIYLVENGVELKKVAFGFKASFLDKDNILYLENQEEKDMNVFHIYDINKADYIASLKQNIINYMKLDKENITLIEKNSNNNDYTINRFNIKEHLLSPIAKINSPQVFYNSDDERGYINLYPPYKEGNLSIIYSVDLKKLAVADSNN